VTLIIDNVGFVYIDGVRVARWIPDRQALQFWDRNRNRTMRRGSRYVEVELDRLMRVLNEAVSRGGER